MNIAYRGATFSGSVNDAKLFGYLPAIILNEYVQIEAVHILSIDLDSPPDIFWFPVNRSVLEQNTGLGSKEQLECEVILKRLGALEISDDGQEEIKARINHKLLNGLKWNPEFYIDEFKKAGII